MSSSHSHACDPTHTHHSHAMADAAHEAAVGAAVDGGNTRRRLYLLVGAMVAVLAIIALVGVLMPEEWYAPNFAAKRLPPSLEYPFGTDNLGRNMFWRTVKGLSTSVVIGLAAATVSAFLGLVLGIVSATVGGFVDDVISFLTDLCMSLPHIVLLILISVMLGRGLTGIMVGVALTHWPNVIRVVRAEVRSVRESQYVQAARRFGRSHLQIARDHIVPHVLPQFIIGLVLLFPHAILHEASITFLGFGLSADMPAIGIILSESMQYLSIGMWWLAVLPGAALLVVVMMFDAIGENLRRILDPVTSQE